MTLTVFGEEECNGAVRLPCLHPLKMEPEFQFDDRDVASKWHHMPLEVVDATEPDRICGLLAAAAIGLGREPRMHPWQRNQVQRTETRLALLWRIWTSRPPFHQRDVSAKERCTASLTALFEKLDANKDGTLDRAELVKMAEELGHGTCPHDIPFEEPKEGDMRQ